MAIIPLARPLPAGSSDLPGGRSPDKSALRAGRPLRLPIWSCTARSLPGHACHHTRRCALTLSPFGPHRFTHHPAFRSQILESEARSAGFFSVALVVVGGNSAQTSDLRSEI